MAARGQYLVLLPVGDRVLLPRKHMYPPCPHGNAFGHNLKWKGMQPSLLGKTELPRGRAQATKRHSLLALYSRQNGILSAHTFSCGYLSYWGKFYRSVSDKSLTFIEISYKLVLIKISRKLFLDRKDMKSRRVLDRTRYDSQIASWCWDTRCQSLGSFSAGSRHQEIPPLPTAGC